MLDSWGCRWDFDLGDDTRIVFIRQDNLNKMAASFIPFLGRAASPGDIVVVNSGLHHNPDYAGVYVLFSHPGQLKVIFQRDERLW